MNNKPVSLLDLNVGQEVKERVDYEMEKIIANIKDPNTDPTKKRGLKIQFEIVPDIERENVFLKAIVSPALAPTLTVKGQLFIVHDGKNEGVYEMTPNIPGQTDIYGEVQDELKILKLPAKKAAN